MESENLRLQILKLAVEYDSCLKSAAIKTNKSYSSAIWNNVKIFENYVFTGKTPKE